jgi:sirohydrochlorin cobaltochelatase
MLWLTICRIKKEMKVKTKGFLSVVVFCTICLVAMNCFASGGHGSKGPKKVGILLVAFGSSEESAQISFENIDKKTKEAYPDIPVRWAYTSVIIRDKLAKQGKYLDSPEVALAKMQDEKFTHVAVQSLHTIGGSEYHDVRRTVGAFKLMGGFQKIILGYPLLSTQEDMQRAVDAILGIIPKERKMDEAVVLMGHGTHHPANAFYAALMFQLQLKDPNIFVGTVEGYPEVDLIQELMLKRNIKKAYLIPFMSVAGDHAKNDMASDEEDSWKSIFTKAGINCIPILKGTAEFDSFVDIWVDHVGGPLSHFE